MGCLNCSAELKHTPGKRKKQFCSPDCRVRYWQKNKPKKVLEIDPLSDLIDVRKEQDAFCIERGWNVPDLIEKIKGFEIRIKYYAESKIELEQELGRLLEGQNKTNTAHQIEKRVQDEPEFKNGHQKAEISPETGLAIEGMPEGLTAIQQAVWKNNQKMKTKPAPIAGFGLTKKEKS
jgi:hypothetical protein